jgi:hypothetical protein
MKDNNQQPLPRPERFSSTSSINSVVSDSTLIVKRKQHKKSSSLSVETTKANSLSEHRVLSPLATPSYPETPPSSYSDSLDDESNFAYCSEDEDILDLKNTLKSTNNYQKKDVQKWIELKVNSREESVKALENEKGKILSGTLSLPLKRDFSVGKLLASNISSNIVYLNIEKQSIEEIKIKDKKIEYLFCQKNLSLKLIELETPNLKVFDCQFCLLQSQQGKLVFKNLESLKELKISGNFLTESSIIISRSRQRVSLFSKVLEKLNISLNNFHWNILNYLIKNKFSIKELDLSDNLFNEREDLSYFKSFENLESLSIGNSKRLKKTSGERKMYNDFSGSLFPLKNLKKLTHLNIANTDIDSGLEFLPTSLEKIDFGESGKPNEEDWKSHQLQKELENYEGNIVNYRVANKEKIENITNFKSIEESFLISSEKQNSILLEIKESIEENDAKNETILVDIRKEQQKLIISIEELNNTTKEKEKRARQHIWKEWQEAKKNQDLKIKILLGTVIFVIAVLVINKILSFFGTKNNNNSKNTKTSPCSVCVNKYPPIPNLEPEKQIWLE